MTGIVLVAVVLVVVLVINGRIEEQSFFEDKVLLALSFIVLLMSLPFVLDIHLGGFIQLLNQFFGTLTKMVVRL
ncbi:asparagine N-glycosylation enzyme membrane subunit Stt3 [Bacillus fengqiuensis]|nr:asparagine N-glycosylation enzyme membrane subunit Stt3 [Bacillus fengqiuensis]